MACNESVKMNRAVSQITKKILSTSCFGITATTQDKTVETIPSIF